ncbi:MAG: hypothetical protein ACJ796_16990 [Gemmatimonadaceae bacterium]
MTAAERNWKLVSEGDRKFRLEDQWGEMVAWARGHVVGLNGFFSMAESMAAVPILLQALDEVLERQCPSWRRPEVDYDMMHLVHDGAHEWIAVGAVPLARLHRPRGDAPPNDSFAIELVLPSYVTESTAITAAHAIADRRRELVRSREFAWHVDDSRSSSLLGAHS